jgi:glycolate oxidase
VLAPVGSIESFEPGGGATIARAAGEFGCAHMLSSVCKPLLEGVADAAPDATRLYQLYVRSDPAATDEVVRRAIDRGCKAFCMTVDSAIYSRRERDLAKRHKTAGRLIVEGRSYQASLAWDTVKRVRDKFDIPIVLKGIQTPEDALLAVEHGVEWIYVSNHGGRQLDHGQGSMDVLPAVVAAVAGRAKIIVDGGFCRGTDIVKGIAAGADLIGLGRMQCYAVAAAGQAGVVRMLELLEDEVQRCLMLIGVTKFSELDRSFLAPAQPVNLPHVLSAFPLLEIERYRY